MIWESETPRDFKHIDMHTLSMYTGAVGHHE